MQNKIISFSGGQTSARMLREEMDANPATFDRDYRVLFCNTGREHDATLDFVHECETRWGLEIVWLEYDRQNNEHTYQVVNYWTAARRDSPWESPFDKMLAWGNSLPNSQSRGCSGQLKVRTMRRYLQAQGLETWESYIGIRADESDSTLEILAQKPNYITARFPLNERGTTKRDVDEYWQAQPFRLNIPNHEGNCDLCFLKARWKRVAIMRENPRYAQWWIGWEEKMTARGVTHDGAQWISGKSYVGLLADATHPEFDFMKLDTTEADIPCSCAVGGYRDGALSLHNTDLAKNAAERAAA